MTEHEISKISCKVLSEYVIKSNSRLIINDLFENFNYSDITIAELDEAYNREYLNECLLPKDHLLYEGNVLLESSTRTQPIHKVIRDMRSKYKFSPWQCRYDHRQHGVEFGIIIPKNDRLEQQIVDDMSEYGYYLGSVFLCGDNFIDNNGKWVAMQFEPLEQENIRKEIEEYKYIYHITPKDNIDKIKKFGFIPQEKKDDRFNYPSRTYFVYGNISRIGLAKIADMMQRDKCDDKGIYCIFQINVSKIPKDIDIYYDGNFDNGIFVEDDVPADAIDDVYIYDANKKSYVGKIRECVAKRNIFRKIVDFFIK